MKSALHNLVGQRFGAAPRSEISWRKALILNRAAILRAWNLAFPQHDFGTGRLKRYPLDSFELACDRAEELARHQREVEEILRMRRLLDDNVSLERVWDELIRTQRTPQSTIEAILHSVREKGIAALHEPNNVERLRRCDPAAIAQIDARVARLKETA